MWSYIKLNRFSINIFPYYNRHLYSSNWIYHSNIFEDKHKIFPPTFKTETINVHPPEKNLIKSSPVAVHPSKTERRRPSHRSSFFVDSSIPRGKYNETKGTWTGNVSPRAVCVKLCVTSCRCVTKMLVIARCLFPFCFCAVLYVRCALSLWRLRTR